MTPVARTDRSLEAFIASMFNRRLSDALLIGLPTNEARFFLREEVKPPERERLAKPETWTDEDWFPASKYGIYPRLIVFAGWRRDPVVTLTPLIPFLNFCVFRVKKGVIVDRKPDFKLWREWSTYEYFRRRSNACEMKVERALTCKSIKLSGLAYLDASRLTNEEVDAILNKIDWQDWQNVLLLGFEPSDVIDLLKEKRLVTAVFYKETDEVRELQDYADLYVFSSDG